ncbi:MAG: Fmu (Sun) domain-containing protein, partial [Planctomycetota bacterium]|nr:Fmu (Sun) domain-containing protein [Planctomycetota bacterium]
IVEESIPLLAPGAHLLYSTCSLETAENEEQVDWLVKKFDARVVLQNRIEPEGRPGDEGSGYRDGGFHALLTREPPRSRDESC